MGRPVKLQTPELMKRATHLFWERGVDSVSTRDLEEVLDLRATAIYRRFRTKNQLLVRCLEFYIETVIAGRIRTHLDLADDPMQGLHDFFTSTLEPHPRLRGCLMASTAAHAEWQVPEVGAVVRRGWRMLDLAFERQIVRAQRAHQIPADLDAKATSQALMMSLLGVLSLARVGITDLRPGIDVTLRGLGWRPSPRLERAAMTKPKSSRKPRAR